MSNQKYSNEPANLILISLLKAHGIKRVVASPGATNISFVGSLQNDDFFEIYSCADERSAAYMACGIAAETQEPVVISCTGATSSRNYMPGVTEAFYSKLPILAVTSNNGGSYNYGQLVPQCMDRSNQPRDTYKLSVYIRPINTELEHWNANVQINKAILELKHNGGGPVQIDLTSLYSRDYSVKELPAERVIRRFEHVGQFPEFPKGRTAIFIGAHHKMSKALTEAIDAFCATHDAVVLCDLTSGYHGRYAVNSSLVCGQSAQTSIRDIDTLIHIGEISGDYYTMSVRPKSVWRVSPDGEVRDFFHTLTNVFQTEEATFFEHYSTPGADAHAMLDACRQEEAQILASVPDDMPFSNVWIAHTSSRLIPEGSLLHLGILNTLRSWNFFEFPASVDSHCNTGGFGIDGILSTAIGSSLAAPDKICYCIVGDLAFFYDINSLANRHVGPNLRVMLINNGRGTEFTNFDHPGAAFGADADKYIAAAGHYGNKSPRLIHHFAEDLGYEYLTATTKEEFEAAASRFFSAEKNDRPIIFEVFTDSQDESDALKIMLNLKTMQPDPTDKLKSAVKGAAKKILGEKGIKIAKILKD